MTFTPVHVTAHQRHTLDALAMAFEGTCWTSELTPHGWTWEFEFPTLAQAQRFLAALPTGCQGVLAVLPSFPTLLEPLLEPSGRQPPKLFEFFDWSDRAVALGLRLSRYGTCVYALRRASDGELMADDLTWEQTATLLEQLEGNGRQS